MTYTNFLRLALLVGFYLNCIALGFWIAATIVAPDYMTVAGMVVAAVCISLTRQELRRIHDAENRL